MIIPECKGCGACCAYGRDWVEVTEEDLKVVPRELVTPSNPAYNWESRPRPPFVMRTRMTTNLYLRVIQDSPNAQGERCIALVGEIGKGACCSIYPNRPKICGDFERGSPECTWILGWYGLGRPWG